MVESWPRLHAAHAPPHYEQSALRNEFYFSHLEVAAVSTRLGCFSSVILKHKMFNSDLNSARALKPPGKFSQITFARFDNVFYNYEDPGLARLRLLAQLVYRSQSQSSRREERAIQ